MVFDGLRVESQSRKHLLTHRSMSLEQTMGVHFVGPAPH